MYCGSKKSVSKIVAAVAGTLMLTTSAIAVAATGPSSQSETTTVSITIPERVSIWELDNIDFGTWDFAGDEQGTDNLCVWSNDGAAGAYQVTITSTTGDYILTNATSSTDVDFTVAWNNQPSQTSGTSIPYNTPVPFILSAPTTPTCGGVGNTNSTIIVDIAEAELSLQEANATAYDATLTVTIAAVP